MTITRTEVGAWLAENQGQPRAEIEAALRARLAEVGLTGSDANRIVSDFASYEEYKPKEG